MDKSDGNNFEFLMKIRMNSTNREDESSYKTTKRTATTTEILHLFHRQRTVQTLLQR